jgi:hypothetical protein
VGTKFGIFAVRYGHWARQPARYNMSMFPPPPVVVDADILLRNVDYAVRKGHPGALLGKASPRYSLLSGVVLFATTSVHGEAIRHLPEIADRREVPEDVVWSVWRQLVLPAVRFVSLEPGTVKDPRIEGVHPKDKPTAELAALLAPSVLATDNRKHFRSFALPETATDEVAIDLFHVGQFTIGAKGVAIVPTAGGAALIDGAKKLSARLGTEVVAAIGLLMIVGAGYYLTRPRGRELSGKLRRAAGRAAPVVGEQMVAALQASERIEAFAVKGRAPSPLGLLARQLAVGQSEMTTLQVSEMLRWHGCEFSGGRPHRTETRAWLEHELCFHEVARGRWALGFHAEDLIADSRDGLVFPASV